MDNFTTYATIAAAVSALRALDASASLTSTAAADVAAAIVSLEREAERISEAIDSADYDADPKQWEDVAA